MKIVDCWIHDGKTAVYCTGESVKQLVSKTTVNIGTTSYEILGHDILISSTGVVNVMLLLNTTDVFSTPQDISCTISGDV
ncbi:MAG: hypothetical protein ABS987_11990 [Ruminococcus sp.]